MRERKGHTEAAMEFCRLAGKKEVGVICELVDDGIEGVEEEVDEQREGGNGRWERMGERGRGKRRWWEVGC